MTSNHSNDAQRHTHIDNSGDDLMTALNIRAEFRKVIAIYDMELTRELTIDEMKSIVYQHLNGGIVFAD